MAFGLRVTIVRKENLECVWPTLTKLIGPSVRSSGGPVPDAWGARQCCPPGPQVRVLVDDAKAEIALNPMTISDAMVSRSFESE